MDADRINIPRLLAEKYPNWMFLTPEILQIDDDMNIIKVWKDKKSIVEFYHKRVQGLDLALRKRCRFIGYFWIFKILYENEGIRPIVTDKRNSPIYAYDPADYLCENYSNYTIDDFLKEENRKNFRFIGRFQNSVLVGEALDISITNIRRVAKHDGILLHKGYYFSFEALYPIHKITSDILDLLEKGQKYELAKEEIELLKALFVEFEENYILYPEDSIILSNIVKKTKSLIENYKNKLQE